MTNHNPNHKFKVVITGRVLPAARELIDPVCETVVWDKPGPVPPDLLSAWLADAEGLLSTGNIPIDASLLAKAPRLRAVAQVSVGYDNVDVAALTARGIPFGNTPGVLVEATADIAFGLVLSAARRIPAAYEWVKAGNWRPDSRFPLGVDLFGKTLGIVGMGQIGAAAARRAQASGMRIIYYNRRPRPDDSAIGAAYRPLEDLLAESDFVLVLTPLTPETRKMFDRARFSLMKPTAYFVNAARGAIVDTPALVEALQTGRIAGAALDVTDPEPLPPDHPLLSLSNVIITPHIGSATHETRSRMARLAAENLLAGLAGKPMPACVNPECCRR